MLDTEQGEYKCDIVTRDQFIQWMQGEVVDNNEGIARPVYKGVIDYGTRINCADESTVPTDCTEIAWISKKHIVLSQPKNNKTLEVRLVKIGGKCNCNYFKMMGVVGKLYIYNGVKLAFSPIKSKSLMLMEETDIKITADSIVITTKETNTFTFRKI